LLEKLGAGLATDAARRSVEERLRVAGLGVEPSLTATDLDASVTVYLLDQANGVGRGQIEEQRMEAPQGELEPDEAPSEALWPTLERRELSTPLSAEDYVTTVPRPDRGEDEIARPGAEHEHEEERRLALERGYEAAQEHSEQPKALADALELARTQLDRERARSSELGRRVEELEAAGDDLRRTADSARDALTRHQAESEQELAQAQSRFAEEQARREATERDFADERVALHGRANRVSEAMKRTHLELEHARRQIERLERQAEASRAHLKRNAQNATKLVGNLRGSLEAEREQTCKLQVRLDELTKAHEDELAAARSRLAKAEAAVVTARAESEAAISGRADLERTLEAAARESEQKLGAGLERTAAAEAELAQARLDLQREQARRRELEGELSSARRGADEIRAAADVRARALEEALQLTRDELERERVRAEELGPQVAALARRFLTKASQRDPRRR